jgi:hypothetical protein
MDVKNIKGSLSKEEFLRELLPAVKIGTLGELWEDNVDCNHCKFKDTCDKLSNEIEEEYGVNVYCSQVINILVGDLDPKYFEEA